MNFDPKFYSETIMQAAYTVLQNNMNNLGQQFAEGFMNDYTLNQNNPQSINNASQFFNYVATNAMNANGGSATIRDQQQLFHIVGLFIQSVFNMWRSRMGGNQQMGFGQNQGRVGFGNGGSFGGGSMFTPQRQGGFNQPISSGPSSYLDDTPPAPNQQQQPRQPMQQPQQGNAASSIAVPVASSVNYVSNPLDDLPEEGIEFTNVKGPERWGGERAKDDRIVLGKQTDFKTREQRFVIHGAIGYHREILDDPMQVLRDFYRIVPDSVLGSVFHYVIYYNHLDVLDVPTADFITVRNKCLEAVSHDNGTLLHRRLIDQLKTMQYGPWQAVTRYLTKHINRALMLAARISNSPETFIAIDSFEDLDELLSSSFRHTLTNHPDGRHKLETIVANAIFNALVKNVGVMFEDTSSIPSHAIQSSPVFPYSMQGVYHNKFSIPTAGDSNLNKFVERLEENVLNHKTYLLSRRRVVVTNMLGKKVLSQLTDKPKLITSPIAPVFNITQELLPFADKRESVLNSRDEVEPYASEDHPSEQFDNYYDNAQEVEQQDAEKFGRITPITLPVDQTIFAVQYGVSPEKFLTAVDVFTTIDEPTGRNQLVIAKKHVPTLHIKQ